MAETIFTQAQTVGRSFLRACKRFEEFESTAACAALPRIPHRD